MQRNVQGALGLELRGVLQCGPPGVVIPTQGAKGRYLGHLTGKVKGQFVLQRVQRKCRPEACHLFPLLGCRLGLLFVLFCLGLFFGGQFSTQGHLALLDGRNAAR